MSADELERAKERIRDLETVLGLVDGRLVRFGLTPVQTKVLGLLMALPHVTADMISQRLGITSQPKVVISRMRSRLKNHGVEIKSRHSVGYWLDPEAKDKLKALTL